MKKIKITELHNLAGGLNIEGGNPYFDLKKKKKNQG